MKNIKKYSEKIAGLYGLPIVTINFVIESIVNKIVERVARGETINISGLGQFKKVIRKGRTCRHPINGKPMEWKDIAGIKFRPASRFKKAVRDE